MQGRLMMNKEELKQAISWYANDGYSLSTIAQHFDISVEQLKSEMNNK